MIDFGVRREGCRELDGEVLVERQHDHQISPRHVRHRALKWRSV